MTRGELSAVMRKAACAGRSCSRLSMLKRAYYAHEALPRGFSYTAALYPINPTLAKLVNLGMPKAVRIPLHRLEEPTLVAKVVVDGRDVAARTLADLTHRRTIKPARREYLQTRLQQTLPNFLALPATTTL